MAKKVARSTQRSRKPAAAPVPPRRVRAWPALVIGLVILVMAALLWQYFAAVSFDDRLLSKLPKDSSLAGTARLSAFDLDAVKQLSAVTNVKTANGGPSVDVLKSSGADAAKLREAFEDEFAFANTPRGYLYIFTVNQEPSVASVRDSLRGQLDNPQTSKAGELTVLSGTLKGTTLPVAVSRSGNEVYVASNAGLVEEASKESEGFTTVPKFAEVSDKLPAGRHGYVFFNPEVTRNELGLNVPLFGAAFLNHKDTLDISVATVEPLPVSASLSRTSGNLLIGTDLASASLAGRGLDSLLRLLEEQRQETDTPRALLLQKGLSGLNQTLGTDLEDTYLASVEDYVYGRFKAADGTPGWMGALEFESPQAAKEKVGDLTQRMSTRLTFPVRKQVVVTLPDGTQSREIVGEGREPAQFLPFSVAGREGQAVALPGNMGTVHFVIENQYLVVGSSPEAVERMLTSLGRQGNDFSPSGSLAVRVKLSDRTGLLANRDTLYDWLVSARPTGGEFKLDKASGELTGTLNFAETP